MPACLLFVAVSTSSVVTSGKRNEVFPFSLVYKAIVNCPTPSLTGDGACACFTLTHCPYLDILKGGNSVQRVNMQMGPPRYHFLTIAFFLACVLLPVRHSCWFTINHDGPPAIFTVLHHTSVYEGPPGHMYAW